MRRFLPDRITRVLPCRMNPGKVFDSPCHCAPQVAEGYRAMDGRRAIKTLLRP
ncbi:hypothetical protein Scani_18720 [Streptomyces caniferus]|uniref:Uncharacterized protein n=1 Tax=Streptomyces caniferus TaxID=285557 RepID=A0A640S430_9ACTN|nr:hypothetical protein Scani_18720 [Streptomyces caniferus]